MPGILFAAAFIVIAAIVSRKKHYGGDRAYSGREIWAAFKRFDPGAADPGHYSGRHLQWLFHRNRGGHGRGDLQRAGEHVCLPGDELKRLKRCFWNPLLAASILLDHLGGGSVSGWC